MAIPESVIQDWEHLNPHNQQQAQSYIRLLLTRQHNIEEREYPPRKLGLLADRFHSIADDFNEPLSAFEDYLE